MKRYLIYQIDAFTKSKFKGNPAGVVVNGDGLTDDQMQQIARELNNSETAFLFPPDDNECDGVIRYFTPTVEVPTCGHATIAAMYAKAIEENLDSSILKIKTRIGTLPFEIVRSGDDIKVIMTQGEIKIDPPLESSPRKELLEALGLDETDMDSRCPVQIASTGHSKVMIGIKSRAKLDSLTPDMFRLINLSRETGCNGYFVFTFDSDRADTLTYGRMFAPAIGIAEDPVTGNANGPLGAYLVKNGIVDHNGTIFSFTGRQGYRMGRAGSIEVRVSIKNGEPYLVQIIGEAVVIFKTGIEI